VHVGGGGEFDGRGHRLRRYEGQQKFWDRHHQKVHPPWSISKHGKRWSKTSNPSPYSVSSGVSLPRGNGHTHNLLQLLCRSSMIKDNVWIKYIELRKCSAMTHDKPLTIQAPLHPSIPPTYQKKPNATQAGLAYKRVHSRATQSVPPE
jgi:hypothetical protein